MKHHLINLANGKTYCGNAIEKLAIAFNDEDGYFDSNLESIDHSNYQDKLCINCLKLHEINLIEQFQMETFLIRYELQLPKSNRLRKIKKAKARLNRVTGKPTNSIGKEIKNELNQNAIAKTAKGLARQKRKDEMKAKSIIKNNPIERAIGLFPVVASESKCKIISKPPIESKCKIISKPPIDKPIKKDKPIELTPEMEVKKPLLNCPTTIEVIEDIPCDDDWQLGDPIDDNSIFELVIGNDWKLVRHDKELNLWKLQTKSINKKNKVSNWIDDTEFCPYEFISDIINSGYCE